MCRRPLKIRTEPRGWRERGAGSQSTFCTLVPGPPKLGVALSFITSRSIKSMSTISGHQRKMVKWEIQFVPPSKPPHPFHHHLPCQKLEDYPLGLYTMTQVSFQYQPSPMDIHTVFYSPATTPGSQKSYIPLCSAQVSIKD